MKFMFNLSCYGPGAEKATELKEKLEALMGHYGLQGKCEGSGHENFSSYCGHYGSESKKTEGHDHDKGTKPYTKWVKPAVKEKKAFTFDTSKWTKPHDKEKKDYNFDNSKWVKSYDKEKKDCKDDHGKEEKSCD